MAGKSIWETFRTAMKKILPWTTSSKSRTDAFKKWKIHHVPVLWFLHSQNSSYRHHIFRFTHSAIFLTLSNYYSFIIGLSAWFLKGYKIVWRIIWRDHGSCKTVPVHIERLKSFITSMNILIIIIVILMSIVLYYSKHTGMTYIGLPTRQIWLHIIFLCREYLIIIVYSHFPQT